MYWMSVCSARGVAGLSGFMRNEKCEHTTGGGGGGARTGG